MKGAIDVLMHTRGLRSVAILGDMYELGETSRDQHGMIGSYAAEKGVQLLVAVGKDARYIAEGAKKAGMEQVRHFPDKQAFLKEIGSIVGKGDVVLVKGSRGMEMEEIVNIIME